MHERILSGTDLGPLRRRLQGRLLPGGVRLDLVYVPQPGRGERLDLRRGAYDGAALFACLSIAIINCTYFSHQFYTIFAKQVLPSSEVELTFTILVVDTSIPAPDPPPPMNALADVITTHFPDERLSRFLPINQSLWKGLDNLCTLHTGLSEKTAAKLRESSACLRLAGV